ncbi:HlyD family efflux transporter periplasmic adaptor subunit, partial [Acinetobacter baumannii]|uniref:HlyD family efflux transporter periplasmic adaptor subunit n=1 Tax=Acinetobacter baumannii TaxID=470 RepID=UPI0018984CED
RAPLSGTVQSVRVSVGETTGSTPLFEVIDTAALWAELKVFPGVRQAVKTGQTVLVTLGQGAIKSRIASITPVGDQPYVLARVPIDNADQRAVPGELVSARIVTATDRVPLAVDNRAVQYLRGEPVVFVKEGNAYQ